MQALLCSLLHGSALPLPALADAQAEGVLLVAANVGITHEVEHILVLARLGSRELELHPGLALECKALDCHEAAWVGVGLTHTHTRMRHTTLHTHMFALGCPMTSHHPSSLF